MTRRTCYVSAIAAFTFCLFAESASATHVQCGDTVTTNVTLDSDVNCGAGEQYGLTVGASGVTVKLNGHTIRGVSDGNVTGIFSPELPVEPLTDVVIKGGAIEGFDSSVHMGASDTTIHNLTSRTSEGLSLLGDRITVSKVQLTVGHIFVSGSDAFVWGNRLNVPVGSPAGDWFDYVILVGGDRPRVTDNHVLCQAEGCSSNYAAINVVGPNALVTWNSVTGDYAWGIYADSAGGRVRENESTNNHTGISVLGAGALAGRNVAKNLPGADLYATGVYAGAGVTVRNNSATDNSGYGIYAEDGAIDGGGNTATGSGIQDCTPNIGCSP